MADDFRGWWLQPADQFDGWALQPAGQRTFPASPRAPGESALRGAEQGLTFGFSDELAGAGQSALQLLADAAAKDRSQGQGLGTKALAALGIDARYPSSGEPGIGSAVKNAMATYFQARDAERSENAQAQAANPMSYLGGSLAGSLLTAKLPMAGGGGLAGAVKTGALYGGLGGLGTSTSSNPVDMAFDAAGVTGLQNASRDIGDGNIGGGMLDLLGSGALGGGIAGAGGYGLGKAASPLAESLAVSSARKALTSGARQLSNKEPLSKGAALAALRPNAALGTKAAIEPFGTTHGAYERLQDATGRAGNVYGGMLDAMDAAGVPGAEVNPLVNDIVARGAQREQTSAANMSIPNAYLENAQAIEGRAMGRQNLPLRQAEGIKRTLQQEAKYGTFTETPINEAKRDIASMVRQANEDAVARAAAAAPAGSPVRVLGENFVPVKQGLGHLYEAEQAAREGAARGAHRATFGLPEQIEMAKAFSEGDPSQVMRAGLGSALHSIFKERLPSTLATSAHALMDPATSAKIASWLQRGTETGTGDDNERALAARRALIDALARQAP